VQLVSSFGFFVTLKQELRLLAASERCLFNELCCSLELALEDNGNICTEIDEDDHFIVSER
jgi:hypothetical protein